MPIIVFLFVVMMQVHLFAASKDFTIKQMRVIGNSNDRETILAEVRNFLGGNSIEKVTGIASLKSRIQAQLTMMFGAQITPPDSVFITFEAYTLTVSSSTADSATVAVVGNVLSRYVNLRMMGHSAGYAAWVAWSGLNECPMDLGKEYPGVKLLEGQVAYPWVRRNLDNIPLLSFPLLAKSHSNIPVVVDGDLAWAYWPAPSGKYDIRNRMCFDALEFNSDLREIFLKLKHDWNARKKRTRRGLAMWSFFGQRLSQKYHIIWRDPTLLNLETIFD